MNRWAPHFAVLLLGINVAGWAYMNYRYTTEKKAEVNVARERRNALRMTGMANALNDDFAEQHLQGFFETHPMVAGMVIVTLAADGGAAVLSANRPANNHDPNTIVQRAADEISDYQITGGHFQRSVGLKDLQRTQGTSL